MKRHLTARLLCLLLCLALCSGLTVHAVDRPAAFTPSTAYDGRFLDVKETDWFYPNVATLFSLGLTRGKTADLFGVYDNISVKEVIGFAARVRSLYFYGDAEMGAMYYVPEELDEELWYLPYVLYLKSDGVLDDSLDGRMDQAASRSQTAHLAARALPAELFLPINDAVVSVGYATHAFIPDVDEYTPYQRDILQLYKWGVVSGSDEMGRFFPDEPITRSEFSALLTRLTDPALRVVLDWDVSAYYSAKARTYADLVTPGTYRRSHGLNDLTAIDSNIRYMLSDGASTISLQLTEEKVNEAMVSALMENYLTTIRKYIEQGYNAVSCSYNGGTNRVTMRFYSSLFSDGAFATARSRTLSEAIRIHDQLWADGVITSDMSQREKAYAYYDYICSHCTYDYQAVDNSISHSAYSLFFNGTAVCDGYTAAYNLLLKLEGIDCTTWSTESHIWTVATLDGQTCHIDTTWGSQSPAVRGSYFGMTERESLSRF